MSGNNRSFTYDPLGQLKTASGPWGSQTNSYDGIGNLHSRVFTGTGSTGWSGPRTIDLQYDNNNRVYQSVDSQAAGTGVGGTGIRTVDYDPRGNITTLGGTDFTYDYSDQPTIVSGMANGVGASNGTYWYDGNLKRVKSVVNGKTIYNVYDASGSLAHVLKLASGSDPETRSDYVKLGGMAIARVENKTTPFYSFSDHLGSPVAVWEQGGAIERERYTPFGITLDNPASLKDQAGFTGHIKDSATGLNYMQARYYDPIMGRFLSIDPVTFTNSGGDPGYFNRYAYTMNDPVNATDPTGEWVLYLGIDVKAGSGSIGGGGGGGAYIGTDKNGKFDFGTYTTVSAGAVGGYEAGLEIGGAKNATVEDLGGTSVSVEVNVPTPLGVAIAAEGAAAKTDDGPKLMTAVGVSTPSIGASVSVNSTETYSAKQATKNFISDMTSDPAGTFLDIVDKTLYDVDDLPSYD